MSTRCLILTAAGAAMATVWVATLSGLLVAHLAGEASSRVVLHVALAALSVASVLVGVAMLVESVRRPHGERRRREPADPERVDAETRAAIHHIGERLAPRHDHRA